SDARPRDARGRAHVARLGRAPPQRRGGRARRLGRQSSPARDPGRARGLEARRGRERRRARRERRRPAARDSGRLRGASAHGGTLMLGGRASVLVTRMGRFASSWALRPASAAGAARLNRLAFSAVVLVLVLESACATPSQPSRSPTRPIESSTAAVTSSTAAPVGTATAAIDLATVLALAGAKP